MRNNLTIKRKKLLDIICNSAIPINAKEIYNSVDDVNLATVYRGLKYLTNNNIVESFTVTCDKDGIVSYYYNNRNQHKHFFHCQKCHKFIPYFDCSMKKQILKFESDNNCKVSNHIMYLIGVCSSCRKKKFNLDK